MVRAIVDKTKLLFVDDEKQILIALRALFRTQYQVFLANSGAEALDILRRESIHVIVSDQRMPHMLGHELLREVKKLSPHTIRLLLTGYADISAIVQAINEGEVFRFINKPWDNDEIRSIIGNAVDIALATQDSAVVLGKDVTDSEASQEHLARLECQVGLLVIDDAQEILTKVRKLYANERPIYEAHSIEEALELLAHHDVGVIITDITVHGEDTTDFIKLLKQQYPLAMTIVLTEAADSKMAIELINQGKVYRYLPKSLGANLLHLSIKNALHFYQVNRENPELLQRQQVEISETARNSSLAQRLVSRLKSLRLRFRFGF